MSRDYVKERRLSVRGGNDVCVKCHLNRTWREDGICSKCNYKKVHEETGVKFGVKHPIPFPAQHRDAVLPCETLGPDAYMQDEASQEARESCWSCPVKDWCLDFGMYNNQWGIWGGLTQRERAIVLDGLSKSRYGLVA